MKILVTGITGFVGENLRKYFDNKGGVDVLELDLRSDFLSKITPDIDAIVHLAGKAHDLKQTSDSKEYYEVNFELTKKLYDVFLTSKVKNFIYISSVKAAADRIIGILKEDINPSPETHYGKSKLMAEKYIQAQSLTENKAFYILRPCMIHGPSNKGNLNLLFKLVKMGFPYPLAAFENKRSFLSIDNLCFIIKEFLSSSNAPSGIYNVADDEPLSTNEVISILAKSIGRKPIFMKVPRFLVKSVAQLGHVLKLPFNIEKLDKLSESYIVSNNKVKTVLNIDLPVTAKEGLKITAQSFNNS
jgi:nucleoside-diphosphate-sugar epimerase